MPPPPPGRCREDHPGSFAAAPPGRAEGMRTAPTPSSPSSAKPATPPSVPGRLQRSRPARRGRSRRPPPPTAATEKGIRDQAVRLVQETPIAGRRKYLKAVARRDDERPRPHPAPRLRDLAKETGRHFAAGGSSGRTCTLNADRRENARKLIDDVRKLYALLRQGHRDRLPRRDCRADPGVVRGPEHDLPRAEEPGQGGAFSAARSKPATTARRWSSREKRPEIPAPTNPNRKRDKGRIRVALDKFLTFQSLMQALDQEFYGNGMFARGPRHGRATHCGVREGAGVRRPRGQDRPASTVTRGSVTSPKSSGVLGEHFQQWINVSLGEFKRITLGKRWTSTPATPKPARRCTRARRSRLTRKAAPTRSPSTTTRSRRLRTR